MVIEKKNIELIKLKDVTEKEIFHLKNCIIGTIDLVGASKLKVQLIIENCIITNLNIYACWFEKGFILENNIILNFIDYQMGGHNDAPIVIKGNIFNDFFNFFDCQFNDIIEIQNNCFIKGTNLLGNKGEGFENIFETEIIIKNNIGRVDMDL
jgi:hypothetical protein